MKSKNMIPFLVCLILTFNCSSDDASISDEQQEEQEQETIYFPPINNTTTWETTSIADLEWNSSELQPLLDYLEEKNTKSFMILHNGKIVVEHYMNGHSNNSPWYWASAGKTLTTTIAGIAQDEDLLDINDKVSDYLGTGWTSLSLDKENLITCKNLLSMNSGLNDELGNNFSPENLQYLADAGNRWAYHNVFVKLQDVIANASNESWTSYFSSRLRSKIGMTGSWVPLGDLNVYWSDTRSMARFGLMISAGGRWEETQIISEAFLNEAINTSQDINEAYGYLWWLNGKSSYHLPQTQLEFDGSLVPNAPNDMYCAWGRNDQLIYIVPSQDLVIIRMGEAADDDDFTMSTFDDVLWEKINTLTN